MRDLRVESGGREPGYGEGKSGACNGNLFPDAMAPHVVHSQIAVVFFGDDDELTSTLSGNCFVQGIATKRRVLFVLR